MTHGGAIVILLGIIAAIMLFGKHLVLSGLFMIFLIIAAIVIVCVSIQFLGNILAEIFDIIFASISFVLKLVKCSPLATKISSYTIAVISCTIPALIFGGGAGAIVAFVTAISLPYIAHIEAYTDNQNEIFAAVYVVFFVLSGTYIYFVLKLTAFFEKAAQIGHWFEGE